MKKGNVIITIPIYTTHLSEQDWASIKQCFKILQDYTICYVKPESLDISPVTKKLFCHKILFVTTMHTKCFTVQILKNFIK